MFNIGERFREVREQAGYTQEQLAEKLGVEQFKISKIETGYTKSPGIFIIMGLCRVARISVDDFLNLENELPLVLSDEILELVERAKQMDSTQITKLKEFLDTIIK